MPPTLEHVMTFRAVLSKEYTLMLGPTKGNATRGAAPLIGGFLKGDGFIAELLPGGSDWPRIDGSAGVAHLDGRAQFRDSQSGDMFYLTIQGIMALDEAGQLALGFSPDAKSTKAGDHKWFTTPIIEVSNEKHKYEDFSISSRDIADGASNFRWMEQSWFVSQGHWHIPGDGSQAAEHDIYRVLAG